MDGHRSGTRAGVFADVLSQDLRHALSTLVRDPGFSAVTTLTLAIGIGINTAVFSVVHAVLLAPLPYEDPDRLVMVWTAIADQGIREAPSAYANIEDWKALNRVFQDLATFDPTTLTLTDGDWPEQVSTAAASANLFSVLGVAPAIGRMFSPEEERKRAEVTVLSHELSQRRFGASPAAIGRTVEVNGMPMEVIGVMPEGFAFPDTDTQMWLPQTLSSDWDATVARRGTDSWRVVGRLEPGVSVQRARGDMSEISARLERAYPSVNEGLGISVVPLYDQVTGYSVRLALWTLFGAVALVLVIACANAAHLILARGLNRSQEFSLRVALGATTPRLIRLLLTESMVLSLVAGLTGLGFAVLGLRALVALAPANLPRLGEIGINTTVLIYAIGVSIASGVFFGVAPALSHSRTNPYHGLREGGGSSQPTRGHHGRRLLLVMQFALAIVLVFGANLLIRSFVAVRSIDPGFEPTNVLMANLSAASPLERVAFYKQVIEDVRAIPGVEAVGIVEDLFISGAPNRPITVEGGPSPEPTVEELRIDAVDGEFLRTLSIPLREGRVFSGREESDTPPVAIINETMARRFWPEGSPVGRRFRTGGPGSGAPWIEVVGVVGDMRRQGLERDPIAQAFRPYAQEPSRNMNLLVRTEAPLPGLAGTVRTRIADIDRTVPLYRITTVAEAMDRYLVQRRFQTLLLGLFSVIALALAAIGIYGLMQYTVSQRTRDLGVRLALGAASDRLVLMVLGQGLTLALTGLVSGLVVAVWLSRWVSALLFGVSPFDVTTMVITSAILLLTTLVACYMPARRASSIDPMAALRHR